MNFDIFRAYDVRGIYPSDIDEEACYEIARAYSAVFEPETVAVGMDARLSSPSLEAQVVRGLIDSGVNVIEVGEVTTDMLYFAVGAYGFSGGIIVSASHNPKEYNGLKMVRERVTAISSDTGLFDIRDMLRDGARILSWEGTRFTAAGVPVRQQLKVEFRDRRLRWSFENILVRPDDEETTISLISRQVVVPNTWQHHQLRFGKVEFRHL